MTKKTDNVVNLPVGEKVLMEPAGDTPEASERITVACNALLRLLMTRYTPDEAGTITLNLLGGILRNACEDTNHFEESLAAVHRDMDLIVRSAWKDRKSRRGH